MYELRGRVNIGSKAPRFNARDVRGETFDNATYTGRGNLVIFFYRNSECQTCREELKALRDKYGYIAGMDSEVVAISVDNFDEAKNLSVDLKLPFVIISDPEHRIIEAYGVFDSDRDMAYPVMFLVDNKNVVRHKRAINGLDDLIPGETIVNWLREMSTGTMTIGGAPAS